MGLSWAISIYLARPIPQCNSPTTTTTAGHDGRWALSTGVHAVCSITMHGRGRLAAHHRGSPSQLTRRRSPRANAPPPPPPCYALPVCTVATCIGLNVARGVLLCWDGGLGAEESTSAHPGLIIHRFVLGNLANLSMYDRWDMWNVGPRGTLAVPRQRAAAEVHRVRANLLQALLRRSRPFF